MRLAGTTALWSIIVALGLVAFGRRHSIGLGTRAVVAASSVSALAVLINGVILAVRGVDRVHGIGDLLALPSLGYFASNLDIANKLAAFNIGVLGFLILLTYIITRAQIVSRSFGAYIGAVGLVVSGIFALAL
jgi:hypothetical protein